ncbi:MAG: hypothetical protein ACRD8Z_29150 [Nitrososphaeraceae archaeon]
MNTKYMVVVASMAVMLIGATTLATEDAFADKKKRGGYEKSQAVSQVNDCGNGGDRRGNGPIVTTDPIEGGAENVGCQNTASQIQGDENAAYLTSEQEFDD